MDPDARIEAVGAHRADDALGSRTCADAICYALEDASAAGWGPEARAGLLDSVDVTQGPALGEDMVRVILGHVTHAWVPEALRAAAARLLDRCLHASKDTAVPRLEPGAFTLLRRAYTPLFFCIEDTVLLPAVCRILCVLTTRAHVRAYRIRKLLALRRASPQDAELYALLDLYAAYVPDLLQPGHQAPGASMTACPTLRTDDRLLRTWASSLDEFRLPSTLPGLGPASSSSCVPLCTWLAAAVGAGMEAPPSAAAGDLVADIDDAVGSLAAGTLGRELALAFVEKQRRSHGAAVAAAGPADTPLFDPAASAVLWRLHERLGPLGDVPSSLHGFLTHVVQSACADAVRCLNASQVDAEPLAQWEAAWAPAVEASVALVARLRPAPWLQVYKTLVRPLCYLATMEDVSDSLSAGVFDALVQLYLRWMRSGAESAAPLKECLLELEEALLVDGFASLPVYEAAFAFHRGLGAVDPPAARCALYPFPFFSFACAPAMTGSVVLLERAFELVLALRASASAPDAAGMRELDEMTTLLVEMVWSGRAFATLQQRGLSVDGSLACDGGSFVALRQVCDNFRIVPFGLIASPSHGALLAPLLERYVNEVLLAESGAPHIALPITPSALRPARQHGLPPHLQYTDIRLRFFEWLGECGAPALVRLLLSLIHI